MLLRRLVFVALGLGSVGCERAPPVASATPDATPSAVAQGRFDAGSDASASHDGGTDAGGEPHVTQRVWFAEGFVSGTAARLDLPLKWDLTGARPPGTIAAMPIRPSSVRPLATSDVARLAELLRSPTGFNDKVMKRCLMGALVGFRMTRRAPALPHGNEVVDIAIDMQCSKLFIVTGDGSSTIHHATHYDPSRAEFLELARRALPDDTELRKVR